MSQEHPPSLADDGAASTSVSSVEVYGFVWWITSAVAYVAYLLWAYTPEAVLHRYGITYYPSKYWAVALPSWVCVSVVYAFWAYEGLNMMSAQRQATEELIQRGRSSRCPADGHRAPAASWQGAAGGGAAAAGVPPLELLDPAAMSRLLYGHDPVTAQ